MQIARALALVVFFAACAQPAADTAVDSTAQRVAPPVDTAGDRQAAERLWAHTAEVFKRGDAAAFSEVYTEDAALITERGETRGLPTIRSNFEQVFLRTVYRSFEHTVDRFESDGQVAFEEGTVGGDTELRSTPGKVSATRLRYLAVYKRQPNGGWLFHRVVTVPQLSPAAK